MTVQQLTRVAKARTLKEILTALGIGDWQYLLIGDGSGNRWEYPAAWACLMIEEGTNWRDVFWGSSNCGTNNLAEMMAYVMPLLWLESQQMRRSEGTCNVHILTDSQWVRDTGNRVYSRDTHRPVWKLFADFERRGMLLHWHYVPGHAGVPANEFCDKLAGMARKSAMALDTSPALKTAGVNDILKLYPK